MNILYIGGGFVGACSAAVSADSGHETFVYDIDVQKIQKLSSHDPVLIESCIHEKGLSRLFIQNRDRLYFTSTLRDLVPWMETGDAIFFCLPTPENSQNGGSDLSYYEKAVEAIGPLLCGRNGDQQTKRILIVNKSTVPISMIDYTRELFEKQDVKNFGIVSNPEFLVEGKAIENSIHPDRVVVGAESEEDFATMRRVYQRFRDAANIPYIEVNPYEAAAGKLLANFLLFEKVVTTYDVVGRVAESFPNISFEQLRKILISDPRIGSWGLYNSFFAGGSCFIKDAASLAHQLEETGAKATIVRETLASNMYQLDHFFERAEKEVGFFWEGKRVAVLGLAFKQDTNDIRNSGAIQIIERLLHAGVREIRAYDPCAMDQTRAHFDPKKNPQSYSRISYHPDEVTALQGTDAVIISTDWPQFKTLDQTIRSVVRPPYLIMDGRRILAHAFDQLHADGYGVIAVGR